MSRGTLLISPTQNLLSKKYKLEFEMRLKIMRRDRECYGEVSPLRPSDETGDLFRLAEENGS